MAAAEALADALRLDHQHAGLRRRTRRDGRVACSAAIGATRFAQRLQLADPAHVALAPAGDAVAHPMLFGDDLAVKLVLLALFFRQQHVAPFLEMGKAALDPAGGAAVEPDRRARQRRQKAPVVADDHQRGAAGVKIALQPFDGGEVEMIGRLVEQQDIGRRRQHARERDAARFAAGQLRRIFRARETEFLEQMACDVGIVGRLEAGFDIGQRRGKAGEVRLLRQITHDSARLHEHRAAIGLDQPRCNFQQRRLARAVASDQRHAFAGGHRQLRAGEQRRAAEGQGNVFELQKWRSHTFFWLIEPPRAQERTRPVDRFAGPVQVQCRASPYGESGGPFTARRQTPVPTRSKDESSRCRACL